VRHLSLDEFTARLASADPTPGGGSAAAVAGALGAALVAMLARLSMGRGGDDALFTRTAEAMDAARMTLLDFAAEDARAYDGVMAALRMPKGSDAEKRARTQAIQVAMREAAEVPLDVTAQAAAVLEAARAILPTANPNAVSDGAVAVLLSYAAAHGAIANVRVNLASIRDEEYRRAITARVDQVGERTGVLRDEGLAIVRDRLAR
jgi:formiminotetrahydrofolate cyclodeaminase